MSVLDTTPPTFSLSSVQSIIQDLYGISGTWHALDSERDQNFRLQEADGQSWVIKIANAAEDLDALKLQSAMLKHASEFDSALALPGLKLTKSGALIGTCSDHDGRKHFVRVVNWLPGKPFAFAEKTPLLFAEFGSTLGRLSKALQGFAHASAIRDFDWDITQAGRARERLVFIQAPQQREILEYFLNRFDQTIAQALRRCRAQVIHGDANDYNVLVDEQSGTSLTGLIDFGDAVFSPLINELAVAAAYAVMDREAPIDDVAIMAAAFHQVHPLQAEELDLLFDLIALRLVISVTMSASRQNRVLDNEYLKISEAPAWSLLKQLRAMDPKLVAGILRHACGFEVAPNTHAICAWIKTNHKNFASILDRAPAFQSKGIVPLGNAENPIAQLSANQQPDAAQRAWQVQATEQGIELGIGPWGELRSVYTSEAFASVLALGQRRTMHLGLDLFDAEGSNVRTPIAAVVVEIYRCDLPLDYGHAILLQHTPEPGITFYSLWGHLSAACTQAHRVGDQLNAGDIIGQFGNSSENGGWMPHVHIQLCSYRPANMADVIGVGELAYRAVWAELFPDASDFANIPRETFSTQGRDAQELLPLRKQKLINNLSLSYKTPMKIVRGEGVYLYDERGRAYLDCYNNVAHLGHAHPEIVATQARQAALLNTNTRYLHDNIINYAEALTATLPSHLTVAAFVCSGSEANDLALRMARAHTQAQGVIALEGAYHGHLSSLIEISPYKYNRKGGKGRPATTGEAVLPDAYRAPADWPKTEIGPRYAQSIHEAIEQLQHAGHQAAAFIAESLPSSAGQIVLPEGYLKAAYANARAAGALVIADEVQIGFGRTGSHMWAFEAEGASPDIVTMGKPIGNGQPMAALVTSKAIADSFHNGMEYFNTFGGNAVSCAIGLKVLEILQRDQLLANAFVLGNQLLDRMRALMDKYPRIGDVRGRGFMLGIELVEDRQSKRPATAYAGRIVEKCRALGILLGTDGAHDNVIKMRPAMIFSQANADLLMQVLETAFAETE